MAPKANEIEFKIEKGVPFKQRQRKKYPLADMEAGDSFFIATGSPRDEQGRVASAVQHLRKSPGCAKRAYQTARVIGGIRVWRTA